MSKICVRCSTVNLDNFTYCKYCGAALPTVEKRQSSVPFREHIHDEAPEYEGSKPTVSEEEYAAYVGKNTRFILPKFRTLKETGRIELREGIIDKLIKEFCDSPYINQENYAERWLFSSY